MIGEQDDSPASPGDGFAAIEAAGKENPNPSPDSDARRESQATFNDEPRLISQGHRWMRVVAFVAFGATCILFLLALLATLRGMFSVDAPLIYLLARDNTDWHVWIVVSVTLVVFAAVPLTIAMALVRMISHSENTDQSKPLELVTPQIEMLKICLDALKRAGK